MTTPIRHAWATVREAAESGSREVDDEQLDSIEPGIRLLELSAAYRAAFEEHTSAQAEAMIAINKHRVVWERADTRFKAAEDAMRVAQSNLLSAALGINVRPT